MSLNWRAWLAFGHDLSACAAAWLCAYWLRFTPELPDHYLEQALYTLLWIIPVHAVLFWSFGLYRGMWRYASLPDLRRILMAVGVAAVAVPTLMLASGLLALAALALPAGLQVALVAVAATAYLALIALIERAWRIRRTGIGEQ